MPLESRIIEESKQIPEAMISIINITTLGNLSLISYMMYTCLVIYSLISAYLIKIMDGGHPQVLLYHFVIILWIASLVSVATEFIINKVLGVGIPIY